MIEVQIDDAAWTGALPQAEASVVRAAQATLSAVDAAEADVVILLADDDAIADLNTRFRGKTGPTNVLSFPAPATAAPHLGDVALAFGVCAREAAEQDKALEHHLMHLVAHGVLHLVGYDHQTESEADSMEALERQLMKGLGAPDPYEAGPSTGGHAR
jgi:probable rRNA maturation factor